MLALGSIFRDEISKRHGTPTLGNIVVLGTTADSHIADLGGVGDVREGNALGESVSSLEFGHLCEMNWIDGIGWVLVW